MAHRVPRPCSGSRRWHFNSSASIQPDGCTVRAERAAENLREQERIARIENDTARALVLLAWRRLDEKQFRIISDGLKDPKIDKLQVAALAGDPEANLFATDILRATKEAGYGDIRMGQIVSFSGPYVGLNISGPAQEVARLVALLLRPVSGMT
jgi:hypothetical protein